jgi:hypothetical protein
METEARMIIYFYLAVAVTLLMFTIVILAFRQFKQVMDETSAFIKVLIGLYEQERDKNERKDD